jgi:drug/metabolite transporter (DMT)-like permease
MRGNRELIASVVLGVVALVWGTTYAVIKDTLSVVEPYSLMMMRFSFSAIILSGIYFKKLRKLSLDDIKRGSIIGIFMFLAFYFLIISIRFTTASKFSFIIGAYVLIVPFLSYGLGRRKLNRNEVIGAIVATIGLGFLTIERGVSFNLWDLVAGCCSFFFAAHMVAIEKYSGKSDAIALTIIQFIVTALIFIILTGVKEGYNFSVLPQIKWTLGYLVIVSTVIPFAIQNIVQRYISATATALILTLQSAFGSIFAVYYLDERMSLQMILGCILIFVAIVLQQIRSR